jgi:hypothetical protein
MIKSLTALAIFCSLGGVVALPGFGPRLEASETVALAKEDRLDLRPVTRNCSQQVWPNFDASCLRNDGMLVREARLVTARR